MKTREIKVKDNTRVVTHNELVKAIGLEELSLHAAKLFYIAVSQCKKTDPEFYEYKISIPQFANLMRVDPSNVYKTADSVTTELLRTLIIAKMPSIKKNSRSDMKFEKYSIFSKCKYDPDTGEIYFKINQDMTDFLLGLSGNFTKPLLQDFLQMKSVYSMRIWHLLQIYMKSQKPATEIEGKEKEYYISLEELKEVTGTQEKYKQIGEFKKEVLDKALREIHKYAGVQMEYREKKLGKRIVGFYFKIVPLLITPKLIAEKIDREFELKEI